ncbi:MAG: small ribosomal subunit Rsm22 family protein [Planctomycetota bacterium]|jgi:ribosomal protein RSM22 (predicted rRNA methylase)
MRKGITVPEELESLLIGRALGEEAVRDSDQGRLSGRKLKRIGAAMLELSDIFNNITPAPSADYMESPTHRAAYLLYFLPANFAKGVAVLDELSPVIAGKESLAVADLGAGPGSLSLALLHLAGRRLGVKRIELLCVDTSRAALEDCRFLVGEYAKSLAREGAGVELTLKIAASGAAAWARQRGQWDIVLLGDTLNEMYKGEDDRVVRRAALLSSLADGLKPDGATVVIEPALKALARELQGVRDALIESAGLEVYAPCLRKGPCPLLAEGRERHWCHTGALWMRPKVVRRIDEITGRKKFILKFSYLVVRRQAGSPVEGSADGTVVRAVGDLRREKGKARIMLCGEPGCEMATLLKRDVNDGTRVFTEFERGDIVAIDGWEERADGWRLSGESRMRQLRRFARGCDTA